MRTDDERAVCDYKPEPTARVVSSRKTVRGRYIGSREGFFLVLIGMPSLVREKFCTTSIKDFTIFPPHKKKSQSLKQIKLATADGHKT